MKNKSLCLPCFFLIVLLALTSCNLSTPAPAVTPTFTPTPGSVMNAITDTPPPGPTSTAEPGDSLCDNDYFPSDDGTTWIFAGNNSKTGAYTRTDTVTDSGDYGFTITTQLTKINYTQDFTCTEAGLINLNPATAELAAMFSGPDGNVTVNRLYNSGITLPKDMNAAIGDTWQQVFGWEAIGPKITGTGEFTYYFTAMGLEVVTVPLGSFDAMRIDARIEVELGTVQKSHSTYNVSIWLVNNVGLVKTTGSMTGLPGVDFSDTMELTNYDSP